MTKSPPRPRLSLTLGVIGHRFNRLPEAAREGVKTQIRNSLTEIRESIGQAHGRHAAFFDQAQPEIRLISAMAEGADLMAARATVDCGLTLSVALPFPPDDYVRDFSDEASIAEYRDLLGRAGNTLQLPGIYDQEPRDYAPVGHLILDNADILVAIWDGGESGGRGGTTDLLEKAVLRQIPILWIDATGSEPPRLIWNQLADYPVTGVSLSEAPTAPAEGKIDAVVDTLVRPPSDEEEVQRLDRFFAERWHAVSRHAVSRVILALLELRLPNRRDVFPTSPETIVRYGTEALTPATPEDRSANAGRFDGLMAAFGSADAVANEQGQAFRSAFGIIFFFSALAILAAAVALVGESLLGWQAWILALVQILLISIVVVDSKFGERRDWHGRWRTAREAAERLRTVPPLWFLGLLYGHSAGAEPTWPGWYARAHARAMGLWSGTLDDGRLEAVRQGLIHLAGDQGSYHARTARKMTKLDWRMQFSGEALLVVTIVLAVLALGIDVLDIAISPRWWEVIIGLTAALPAFGSVTFGLRLIGDFEGIAHRSARMAEEMERVKTALQADPPSFPVMRARAEALAEIMLGDLDNWRLATESRKLVAPV